MTPLPQAQNASSRFLFHNCVEQAQPISVKAYSFWFCSCCFVLCWFFFVMVCFFVLILVFRDLVLILLLFFNLILNFLYFLLELQVMILSVLVPFDITIIKALVLAWALTINSPESLLSACGSEMVTFRMTL